jgi:hypothetical protein
MLLALQRLNQVRTTCRNWIDDFASEHAKRARAKAAFVTTSWHNNVLNVSESIVAEHAAELTVRRGQLTVTSSQGIDDSRWLLEVECFITEVIDASGGYVRNSPGRLRVVRWMIASATAYFASSPVSMSLDMEDAPVADAA